MKYLSRRANFKRAIERQVGELSIQLRQLQARLELRYTRPPYYDPN